MGEKGAELVGFVIRANVEAFLVERKIDVENKLEMAIWIYVNSLGSANAQREIQGRHVDDVLRFYRRLEEYHPFIHVDDVGYGKNRADDALTGRFRDSEPAILFQLTRYSEISENDQRSQVPSVSARIMS